ncbi:hypothetical protein [Lacticaseibacillus sharpeae]|jgi:hypothetical protein|uniref:hypothetical protein n=1 Tax=Lacticaseibacillus sharpeae TaxID=1626 RepID=UPI0006CF6FDE|nr:hypothetical protein [Lacticaseibacillus sharpeae]
MQVNLKNIDPLTVKKLQQRAAAEGFSGYTTMLEFYAKKIANEDVVLASDQRYLDLFNRLSRTLNFVDETMMVSITKGLLASPFDEDAQRMLNAGNDEEENNVD